MKSKFSFLKAIHIFLNILLNPNDKIIIAIYKYNDFFLFSIIFVNFFLKDNNFLTFEILCQK